MVAKRPAASGIGHQMVSTKPRSLCKKPARPSGGRHRCENAKMSTQRTRLKDLLKSVPKRWESSQFIVRKCSGDAYVLKKIFTQNKYLALWRKHSPHASAGFKHKRVLDVGANIGAFAARLLADGATVVAVEADPESHALLQKNAPAATHVHAAVVADGKRVVRMFSKTKPGQPNRNSVISDHVNTTDLGLDVPAMRLASVCSRYGPFDLVKLDIEGAEVSVMQQMHATFQTSSINVFKEAELLVYYHVDKFPLVRVFHNLILQLRDMFSVVEFEAVVGANKMMDDDWETQVVKNSSLAFRKLPGFAAAKQDILIYCGHSAA